MTVTLPSLALAVLAAWALDARADFYIVVNAGNPQPALTQKAAVDLPMGRRRALDNGDFALVFDLPRADPRREVFYLSLTGMTPAQVDSYRSRLMFSGQRMPPQPLPNEVAMLEIVTRNPSGPATGFPAAAADPADADRAGWRHAVCAGRRRRGPHDREDGGRARLCARPGDAAGNDDRPGEPPHGGVSGIAREQILVATDMSLIKRLTSPFDVDETVGVMLIRANDVDIADDARRTAYRDAALMAGQAALLAVLLSLAATRLVSQPIVRMAGQLHAPTRCSKPAPWRCSANARCVPRSMPWWPSTGRSSIPAAPASSCATSRAA